MPRASASGLASLGEGGEDALGLAIVRLGAKADAPEAWALGKRTISLVGSTVEVEQAAAGATQPPPQGVEGAPESGEGRPAPADMEVVPPLLPPPLRRMRDIVQKWLCPHSSRKHQAEAPALEPRKALKVSTSSTTKWVMEAQPTIQRGTALARADPKEPDAQGEATKVASQRARDEAPKSLEAEAHESDGDEVPSVAEATKGEAKAPKTSEAEATEARASRTTEAEVAEARAPRTIEAKATEGGVGAVEPTAQEAETEVGQASVPPLVQGPPPS
ncbi:KNR4/SMI1 homolog [Miscanthus floridulus]|uniref:KNR4/SMI1 homolog n=1 Tax=Miscanthus floridulus TaxID=154761 RepID=UPI00345917A7